MKLNIKAFALTCGLIWVSTSLPAISAEEMTAEAIVRRSDDMLRGGESYCRMTMVVTRPEWSRTLTMDAWTQGTKNSLIHILSPAKEKGVKFLKKGREAWQHIPAINRTIKIPPSMMLQSWLGSDFTNDDVVRADSLITDYTHEIISEPTEAGVDYWIVEAVAKPDAPVVWGKIVIKVRKELFVADRADYYDEDGELIKYYETSDIRDIEGRAVATHFVMHDITRPGYNTALTYNRLTFSPMLKPDTFTKRNLER